MIRSIMGFAPEDAETGVNLDLDDLGRVKSPHNSASSRHAPRAADAPAVMPPAREKEPG
jgi:hypothetical protein